jgi:O-antigen/teichoic acid export membrane protein
MAAAALNYLFYPVLGRFLEPAQFGEVQVLATVVVQLSLVFGLARIAIMSGVANAPSKAESDKLFQFSERLLLQLAFVMSALAIIAGPYIAKVLQYDSVWPLYILIPTLILNAVRSSRDAYARVAGRFGVASFTEISASLIKLLLASTFAAIGLGTIGVIFGMLAAYVASAVVMVVLTARWGLPLRLKRLLSFDVLRSLFTKGAVTGQGVLTLSVSAASLVVIVISTIQTVVAKAALAPSEAGLFAGISVIATIVFFATNSIAGVMLASVRAAQTRAHNMRVYGISALLTLGLCIGITAAFCLAPETAVRLLLGVKYVTASHLLPSLTIAMFALAGTNLIISYHIAMRDRHILPIALFVGSIVCTSLVLWHASAAQLAAAFMGSNLIAFVLCLFWTTFRLKKDVTREATKTD